jgi:hypothetical protein
MKIQDLLILIAILFVSYYFLISKNEKLENTPAPTIFGSTNAFTGLYCVDDNLPIVRSVNMEGGKTFQCISKDGINCAKRSDFLTPQFLLDNKGKSKDGKLIESHSPIVCDLDMNMGKCEESFSKINKPRSYTDTTGKDVLNTCTQFNKYITRDAIVNSKMPSNAVYKELESGKNTNFKFFTCTQDALNDTNHWCGQVKQKLANSVCKKRDFEQGMFKSECSDVESFAKTSSVFGGEKILINTNEQIQRAKLIDKCKQRDCKVNRPKDISLDQCQVNCETCANTSC